MNIHGRKILVAAVATFSLNTFAAKHVEVMPGEFVVKLKSKVSKSLLNNYSLSLKTEVIRVVSKQSNLLLVKRSPIERLDFVKNDLESNSNVEYVEPNFIYTIDKTPNDPNLEDLWGMINFGANKGVANVDIDAEKAWDISTGSKSVTVAVIDTGVDYNLEDLKNNMWTNDAELNGEEGVDDDENGFVDDIYGYDFANTDADPVDDHGHGSHCSGTIGAEGNNGVGVVGVNWNVKIMALKFLTKSGRGTLEGAIKAIDYATLMGAHLTSNSWGGGGRSEALKEAIDRAEAKGILFVAAAGNHKADNDANPTYPSSYENENIIAVAAVDNKGKLASFSCYGATAVDIGAPGVDILSTTPGGLKSWSGTSMATPHVSGVVALLMGKESDLDYKQVKERILSAARPLAGLRGKTLTGGMLNAYYTLTNQKAPNDPNDPFYWAKKEISIESAHPYGSKSQQVWEYRQEGVSRMSLHFSRFETERVYDKLTFYNEAGEAIGSMSGNFDDGYSPVIEGSYVKMVLTSDKSLNKFGFIIDSVAHVTDSKPSEITKN